MKYDKKSKEIYLDESGCYIYDIIDLGLSKFYKNKHYGGVDPKDLLRVRVSIPAPDGIELKTNYHIANVKNIGDDYFFFANVQKDSIRLCGANGEEITSMNPIIAFKSKMWNSFVATFKLMQVVDETKDISYPIISIKDLILVMDEMED